MIGEGLVDRNSFITLSCFNFQFFYISSREKIKLYVFLISIIGWTYAEKYNDKIREFPYVINTTI